MIGKRNISRPFRNMINFLLLLIYVKTTDHNIKWDHFDILASGKTDHHCKVKETLFIQEFHNYWRREPIADCVEKKKPNYDRLQILYFVLADQISCRSYVRSVYRMRSLGVSYSFTNIVSMFAFITRKRNSYLCAAMEFSNFTPKSRNE